MIRRLPLLPSLLVLAAVAVMIRLGVWQLDRMHQKDALLARYAAAASLSADAPWPRSDDQAEVLLYRHATVDCARVAGVSAISGQNARGEAGNAHRDEYKLAAGRAARVILGWSRSPAAPDWRGGQVSGWIAPGPRLVADPPLAGLEANAHPDPKDIPNNHLAYAVQWFLFAGVALVIFALALAKRLRAA